MATNGYDKFFRDAQKASGLSKGEPTRPSGSKFKIKPEAAVPKRAKSQTRAGATPEDRLRAELADRMRRKQKQALRKRKKFPAYPLACAVAALVSCAIGYYQSDLLDEYVNAIMSKVEIGFLGNASAAEGKQAPAATTQPKEEKPAGSGPESTGEKKEKAAETKGASAATEAPSTKGWTPEELSFFSKLNERKKELDLREAELVKLEEELQKRKAELDEKLKSLEAMRTDISKTLKTRVANDQEKVDKLVQFYSNMKPQQAAKVIETLNEDLAIEVLDKMKKKNAAEILNMMDAKKARKLSELMTGYQRSTASVPGAEEEAEAAQDDKNSKQ